MLVGDWIMVGMGISVLLSIILGVLHHKDWFVFSGFMSLFLLVTFCVLMWDDACLEYYYASNLTDSQRCEIEKTNESKWVHWVRIELDDDGLNNVYVVKLGVRYHDVDEANDVVDKLPFKLYKSKKDIPNIQECN